MDGENSKSCSTFTLSLVLFNFFESKIYVYYFKLYHFYDNLIIHIESKLKKGKNFITGVSIPEQNYKTCTTGIYFYTKVRSIMREQKMNRNFIKFSLLQDDILTKLKHLCPLIKVDVYKKSCLNLITLPENPAA